jgi:hypothetical protein
MLQAASLFNQLLQHFPRTEFASLVKEHQAERAAKGFTCWTQFVAMTFCQLAHADSLREICNGLACSEGKLVHLGVTSAPNKSTLSYANEHRPAALFEDLFYTSLNRFREQQGMGARKAKFRFKNKLLSLDSTTISLCLDLFPWAKFRRAGASLHRRAYSRRTRCGRGPGRRRDPTAACLSLPTSRLGVPLGASTGWPFASLWLPLALRSPTDRELLQNRAPAKAT